MESAFEFSAPRVPISRGRGGGLEPAGRLIVGFSGEREASGPLTFAQADSLVVVNVGSGGFDGLVARTAKATLTANLHSSYDADDLNETLDNIGHARGICLARDFVLNNLSIHISPATERTSDRESSKEEIEKTLELTEIASRQGPDFPEMLLCVPMRVAPEFILSFTGNSEHVSGAELEYLLRTVERFLVAAADHDIPVTEASEPILRGPDWALVDSCWIRLPAVRQLLEEVVPTAQVFVVDGRLICYLKATDAVRTPHEGHLACMNLLPAAISRWLRTTTSSAWKHRKTGTTSARGELWRSSPRATEQRRRSRSGPGAEARRLASAGPRNQCGNAVRPRVGVSDPATPPLG